MNQKKAVLYLALPGLFFLLPLFLNTYWVDVLNSIGIYSVLALSLNLIVGQAGLFNLGHAAFYATRASSG